MYPLSYLIHFVHPFLKDTQLKRIDWYRILRWSAWNFSSFWCEGYITWRSNTIIPIVIEKKQIPVFSGYNMKCISVCIILVFLLTQWGSFVLKWVSQWVRIISYEQVLWCEAIILEAVYSMILVHKPSLANDKW